MQFKELGRTGKLWLKINKTESILKITVSCSPTVKWLSAFSELTEKNIESLCRLAYDCLSEILPHASAVTKCYKNVPVVIPKKMDMQSWVPSQMLS